MSKPLIVAALALVWVSPLNAAERRELGAHQHGHGKLNIALDGNTFALELEAPGADIAGFEHAAKTDADKAAIKKATETLEKPLALFKAPAAAQCKVSKAEVELETGGDHGKSKAKHDHDHEDHGKHAKEAEASHSEFHAEYVLECASPAEFKTLTLDYFAAFASAQGLTIEVITPKGQSKFEATRDKPVVDLSGLL